MAPWALQVPAAWGLGLLSVSESFKSVRTGDANSNSWAKDMLLNRYIQRMIFDNNDTIWGMQRMVRIKIKTI